MLSRDRAGLCMVLGVEGRFGSDFCFVCKSLAVKKRIVMLMLVKDMGFCLVWWFNYGVISMVPVGYIFLL